jgi:hypothetical protein
MIEIDNQLSIDENKPTKLIYGNLLLGGYRPILAGGFKDHSFVPCMIIQRNTHYDVYLYFNKSGGNGKLNKICTTVKKDDLSPAIFTAIYKRHWWN